MTLNPNQAFFSLSPLLGFRQSSARDVVNHLLKKKQATAPTELNSLVRAAESYNFIELVIQQQQHSVDLVWNNGQSDKWSQQNSSSVSSIQENGPFGVTILANFAHKAVHIEGCKFLYMEMEMVGWV